MAGPRVSTLAAALLALLCAGCVRQTVTVSGAPTPARPAIRQTIDRQIVNALDAGDGDVEIRALRERLAAEPGNIDARLRLAERYERLGFPEIALEHYRLASERFPDDAAAQLRLVKHLRARGQSAEAARLLDRYLARHQESGAEVFAWSGIVHDEAGDVAAGEQAHRAALARAVAPKAYLHNNLGQNLLLQGRHGEAAAAFQEALRLEPRSEIARNNLGVAMAAKPDEAVLQWKSIAGAAAAHNNMAAVLMEEGRYAEARRHLSLALGYEPGSPSALRNLALVAELDGRPATLEPHAGPSVWKRFAGAMGKVFLTPEEKPAEPAARAANGAASPD